MIPAALPANPIKATQVAKRPGADFLNTHDKIYKKAAKPYTNVTIDNIIELFMMIPHFKHSPLLQHPGTFRFYYLP
jgi:hypothetical protein